VGLFATILCTIIDFTLGLLRPVRSRRWLATGLVAFVLIVFASSIAPVLIWIPEKLNIGPRAAALVGAAMVAALIWWSFLPPRKGEVGRLFD
jgi:uncharacterized membrane protein